MLIALLCAACRVYVLHVRYVTHHPPVYTPPHDYLSNAHAMSTLLASFTDKASQVLIVSSCLPVARWDQKRFETERYYLSNAYAMSSLRYCDIIYSQGESVADFLHSSLMIDAHCYDVICLRGGHGALLC